MIFKYVFTFNWQIRQVDAQLCQSVLWIVSRVKPCLYALNMLQRNITFVLSNICHHQIVRYGHVQLDPMKRIGKGFDMSHKHTHAIMLMKLQVITTKIIMDSSALASFTHLLVFEYFHEKS
jgi:hypothetical protein